jgi:broad specificity phosphatase PhoE
MILLVRHGETEWNLAGRFQGWADSPLTSRGVAQAEAIGRALGALPETQGVPVVASPLGRARCTAELIQAARGDVSPITFDDRLKEVSIGAWDELSRDEIENRSPGVFDRYGPGEWEFHCPGGETYEAFSGRIATWLAEYGERRVSRMASSPACCAGFTPACRARLWCACRCRRTSSGGSPKGGSKRSRSTQFKRSFRGRA